MNSEDVRRQWADCSGEYSPAYYAYYGPDERSEAVRELLESVVGTEGRVLEVGCSSGRHLAHLHDAGFERLHGVDINEAALDVMEEHYPELAASGRFQVAPLRKVVADYEAGAFDAVYSVETLQHIHPDDAAVFDGLARLADQRLVTVENEGDHPGGATDPDVTYVHDEVPLYHRDWNEVFGERGLEELRSRELDRTTLRAFRPAEE